MKLKYDFDDILIVPSEVTEPDSRSEINPFYENGKLPLFTAPMDTVIDKRNIHFFEKYFHICLPRMNDESINQSHFASYGFDEFEKVFLKGDLNITEDRPAFALIDVANGHMKKLLHMTEKAKEKYEGGLQLMVGNVARPETFKNLQSAGADYIRIGIGNGNGCLTTVQTGVGYPMASLIDECVSVQLTSKIVADGGFKKYSDIIKALALGADYVMLGSILNKTLESAGDTFEANRKHESWTEPGSQVDQFSDFVRKEYSFGKEFYKKFRGMSTKEVQKDWGNRDIKTSEGIVKMQKVEYTVDGWVENFTHYLRTAMSYTNSQNLRDFQVQAEIVQITNNAFNRFNK
jgi:IMP dehydrogenase/GMP reductase